VVVVPTARGLTASTETAPSGTAAVNVLNEAPVAVATVVRAVVSVLFSVPSAAEAFSAAAYSAASVRCAARTADPSPFAARPECAWMVRRFH